MVSMDKSFDCRCGRAVMGTVAGYSQHTGCDFFGHTSSGHAVLIEAKSLDRPNLPMKVERVSKKVAPGVKRHQLVTLLAAHAHGSHAYVIWRRKEAVMLIAFGAMATVDDVPDEWPWNPLAAHPIADLPYRLVDALTAP